MSNDQFADMELRELREINKELLRGCQAALAYLADPPSEFPENRAEAARIISAAIAKAEKGQS